MPPASWPTRLFCEHETTSCYFLKMKGLIRRYGIPIALYTDRHSVFKNVPRVRDRPCTDAVQSCDGRTRYTEMAFARWHRRLKGRVERTAAGTFQGRLVTELRLGGATTIEELNVVLTWSSLSLQRSLRSTGTAHFRCLPPGGIGSVPRYGPLLQTQPQGGQGQHGKVQVAHLAATARHGTTELHAGAVVEDPGRSGRTAACGVPGRDHPQPGGATPPRHTQKLQRLFLTRATSTWRSHTDWAGAGKPRPWLHVHLYQHALAGRCRRTRCRRQRRPSSSSDRLPAHTPRGPTDVYPLALSEQLAQASVVGVLLSKAKHLGLCLSDVVLGRSAN